MSKTSKKRAQVTKESNRHLQIWMRRGIMISRTFKYTELRACAGLETFFKTDLWILIRIAEVFAYKEGKGGLWAM
eukprot:1158271-Pelagomonas_calceolata.AAC.3